MSCFRSVIETEVQMLEKLYKLMQILFSSTIIYYVNKKKRVIILKKA